MVQKHSPHHLCGDAEEMTSVLPIHLTLVEKPQIRLVDDGGDLKAVVAPFAAQPARGEDAQLPALRVGSLS